MELSTGLFSNLVTLGQLQEVRGLWFNQKTFSLDGYRFIGCRFDYCKLHVNTTNFEIINCHLDFNTLITYGNDPIKIVKLFNSRNPHAFQNLSAFAPERNPDNTISIKGM